MCSLPLCSPGLWMLLWGTSPPSHSCRLLLGQCHRDPPRTPRLSKSLSQSNPPMHPTATGETHASYPVPAGPTRADPGPFSRPVSHPLSSSHTGRSPPYLGPFHVLLFLPMAAHPPSSPPRKAFPAKGKALSPNQPLPDGSHPLSPGARPHPGRH